LESVFVRVDDVMRTHVNTFFGLINRSPYLLVLMCMMDKVVLVVCKRTFKPLNRHTR
jgi:hypothetical protein